MQFLLQFLKTSQKWSQLQCFSLSSKQSDCLWRTVTIWTTSNCIKLPWSASLSTDSKSGDLDVVFQLCRAKPAFCAVRSCRQPRTGMSLLTKSFSTTNIARGYTIRSTQFCAKVWIFRRDVKTYFQLCSS